MLFNYISLPVFMISLAVGLFFVYILGPETKTVYIYPSPENVDKVLFKDKADQCFSLKPEEVECPSDHSLFGNVPIQT
jgi:hypothetical protein